MELSLGFDGYGIAERLEFSDINNTEVDPEPEATMVYEETEKELQVRTDELFQGARRVRLHAKRPVLLGHHKRQVASACRLNKESRMRRD